MMATRQSLIAQNYLTPAAMKQVDALLDH